MRKRTALPLRSASPLGWMLANCNCNYSDYPQTAPKLLELLRRLLRLQ